MSKDWLHTRFSKVNHRIIEAWERKDASLDVVADKLWDEIEKSLVIPKRNELLPKN